MASRGGNVRVRFGADTTDLDRGTKRAEQDLSRLHRTGSRSLGLLKTAALGAGGAIAGGLVVGLKSSVDAAIEAEKSQAKLQAQLKAMGVSYKAHAKQIDEVIQKTSKLAGLDDEDLQDAFTNIVRSTKSVSEGLKLTGVAADIARAKHMDVAQAGQLVGKVYNGNVGALKRLGIAFTPVTAATDKLKESTKHATIEQTRAAKEADKTATSQKAIAALQRTFSGQAASYGHTTAGAMDRFRVASENLREKIGTALLPTVTKVANKLAAFVTQMTDGTGAGGRFAAKLKEIADKIVPIVKFFAQHPHLIAIAVAAWAAYRVAAIAALAITRARLIAQFIGLGPRAAAGGAVAGRSFGAGFNAAAAGRIRAFGWAGIGAAVGAVAVAAIASKIGNYINSKIGGSNPSARNDAERGNVPGAAGPHSPLDAIKQGAHAIGKAIGIVRASGGPVPGSGRGDIVPAMLEPGEFVVRRAVVNRLGMDFFDRLNAQGLARGGKVKKTKVAVWRTKREGKPPTAPSALNAQITDAEDRIQLLEAQGLGEGDEEYERWQDHLATLLRQRAAVRKHARRGHDANQDIIEATRLSQRPTATATAAGGDSVLQVLQDIRDQITRQNNFADSIATITGREAVRVLGDVLSGQIVGYGYAPRAASAGSGVGARY